MKHLLIFLLISTSAASQVSTEFGLNDNLRGTLAVAYEKQTSWNNTQANVRISSENLLPVVGLQTGYQTTHEFQTKANWRFMAGVFYHTTSTSKSGQENNWKMGGSIRMELNNGTMTAEYNGKQIALSIGFLFRSIP